MSIIIKESVEFEARTMTVLELKNAVTKGNDDFNALFSTVAGVLQRINQKDEWIKNNFKRSKEFMNCVITGAGALDNIIIVPIHLVVKGLKIKSEIETHIPKEVWNETIRTVEYDQKNGTKYYIIDGQNRLVNSIKGFYQGDYPLGDKLCTAVDGDEEFYMNNKKYSELPKKYQKFIDNIKLSVVVAQKGDIDSFVDSLIAKNEGVSWETWMKLITKKWFTLYRKNIKDITDNPQVKEVLDKISGKDYSYDKNGHDLIISELLIWMHTKHQVNKSSQHLSYFEGLDRIKSSCFEKLKKYILEFNKGYRKTKTVQNVEFRNYIMLRYAIDHRHEFTNIAIPSIKVKMIVDFVKQYTIYNEVLKNDSDGKQIHKLPNGKKSVVKVPYYYPWACSEYDKPFLDQRIKLLSQKFIKGKNSLEQYGIIESLKDNMSMPSIEEVYHNNPVEVSVGEKLRPSEVSSEFFDRGHIVATNNGGKNNIENLTIQKISHNRSTKDTNLI